MQVLEFAFAPVSGSILLLYNERLTISLSGIFANPDQYVFSPGMDLFIDCRGFVIMVNEMFVSQRLCLPIGIQYFPLSARKTIWEISVSILAISGVYKSENLMSPSHVGWEDRDSQGVTPSLCSH